MNPELWKRAEPIFLCCADLPPAERSALLDDACGEDGDLRQAVEALLHGDRVPDSFREPIGAAAKEVASGADRWIGAQLDQYTIVRRIAEGGMGVVYLAHRSDQQFEQEVAIKLLTSARSAAELRSRFLGERQILANLNHTNIAQLFDGGETDDGVPYLVMEFIDGTPITDFCADRNLDISQRIELFKQVCAAVQYAHGNLIIHRDIKPSNILVTADGVPKLLDFGIAKMLDPRDLPQHGALTMDGTRLLTPRHASPEQILGKPVTITSDVYSLGLLLYELLCGQFPYAVDHTTRAAKIEQSITTEMPAPPSTRLSSGPDVEKLARERKSTASGLAQELRGDLDTIVLKALTKEPERRYRSVQEFADDLRRWAERRPIVARPPTVAYLMSRYWLRHRTAAIGLCATVIAILAGATVSAVGFFKAREAERQAIAESRNSAAVSDFLISVFREARPSANNGEERSAREILDIGVERIESEMADSPVIKANILETMSNVYKMLGEDKISHQLLARSIALYEDHAPQETETRARLLNNLGDLQRILYDYEEATQSIEAALALHKIIGTSETEEYTDALNNLSLLFYEMGRKDESLALMDEALALRRQLFEPPHQAIANSLHNLMWFHRAEGNYAQAESWGRQAVDMRVAVYSEVHPQTVLSLSQLSQAYRGLGKWEEAQREIDRAVRAAAILFDEGHPALTFPQYHQAMVLHERGRLRESAELFDKVAAWKVESLGAEHHDVGMSYKAAGASLLDLGQFDLAEARFDQARDIFSARGSTGALMDANTKLGELMLRRNRIDDAAAYLAVDDNFELDSLESDGVYPDRRLAVAEVFLQQNNPATAQEIVDRLLAEFDAAPGEWHRKLADALHHRGRIALATGDPDGARSFLERSADEYGRQYDPDIWRIAVVNIDLARVALRDADNTAARRYLDLALSRLERQFDSRHPDYRRATLLLNSLSAGN